MHTFITMTWRRRFTKAIHVLSILALLINTVSFGLVAQARQVSAAAPSTDIILNEEETDGTTAARETAPTTALETATTVQPVANPLLPNACGLDVALVFDGSGSIDNTEYGQMRSAFADFVSTLLVDNVTPTQFSITEFASLAQVRQAFTANATTLLNQINGARIQPGGQYTNWEQGLLAAATTYDPRSNPNVVLFASDGNANRYGNPAQSSPSATVLSSAITAANGLKTTQGARIIALGIGDNLNVNNLKAISGPNVFGVDTNDVAVADVIMADFDTLGDVLAQVAIAQCGGTVTVQKLVDGQPASNWEFTANVTGGTATPASDTTDADGFASFDIDIAQGTATVDVAETLKNGFNLDNASCTKGRNSAGTFDTVDSVDGIEIGHEDIVACVFENLTNRGTITVKKFNDVNLNGVKDGGENYLPSWEFTAKSGATTVDQKITDGTGTAVFTLPVGTYKVIETLKTGWQTTTGIAQNNIAVVEGQNVTVEFGNAEEKRSLDNPFDFPGVCSEDTQYKVTTKGIGLQDVTSGTFTNYTIPGTRERAYLIWEGRDNGAGDPFVTFNGTPIIGQQVREAFVHPYNVAYYKDVTSLVSAGTHSYALQNVNLVYSTGSDNDGATLITISTVAGDPNHVQGMIGLDAGYYGLATPHGPNSSVHTFTFDPAPTARTVALTLSAGGSDHVHPARAANLWTMSTEAAIPANIVNDAGATEFPDVMQASDGNEWDTITVDVLIPAGADKLAWQMESPVPPPIDGESFGIVAATIDLDLICDGDLKVTKIVKDGTAQPHDFGFRVNSNDAYAYPDQGENMVTFEELATGLYTVSETGPANYHMESTTCEDVEVKEGQTAACTITNVRNEGGLIIRKQDANQQPMNVYVAVDGPEYDTNGNTGADGMIDFGQIPTDTYDVTETSPQGYTANGWSCEISNGGGVSAGTGPALQAAVVAGKTTTCTFTNSRDTGTIVVHKDVVAPNGVTNVTDGHSFTVELDGGNSQSITESTTVSYQNVATGLHTVSELADPDFALVSITGSGSVVVGKGQTTHVYVINKQRPATVTVVKDVRGWNGSDVADDTSFSVTLDGETKAFAEGSNAVYSVAPGTYTAAEVGIPAGYLLGTYAPSDTVTVGSNGQATITITNLQNQRAIELTKVSEPTIINVGGPYLINYTLVWHVTGNAPVTNLTLTDPLPANVILQSASESYTYDDATRTITWNLGTRNPGETDTVGVVVQVETPIVNGMMIWNTATLDSSETDPVSSTAHTTVFTDVEPKLEKFGPSTVAAGNEISYTLAWSIDGENPAMNLVVTDTVPANTTFVSASCGTTAGTCAVSENAGVVTWNLGNRNPDDGGTLGLTVKSANLLKNGTIITNTGLFCLVPASHYDEQRVTSQEGQEGNCDEATTTTTVASAPVLAITKTDSPDPVAAGGQIAYTIGWSVGGNAQATNVTITDPLPANATFVSASNSGVLSGSTVTWALGTQNPGASGSVTLTVKVASPIVNGTVLSNTATLDSAETDPVSATATTTVASAPSLAITKTSDVGEFTTPGLVVTYTITVTNAASATDTARNVIVTDTLPTGFTTTTGATAVTFPAFDLAPGASKTLSVAAVVGATTTAGTYRNTATAKGDNTPTVTATADVTVRIPAVLGLTTSPELTITKDVNTSFTNPGKTVRYAVTVENVGNEVATNVFITDTLPKGFSFVDGVGREKTFSIGDLAPGHKRSINYEVLVTKDVRAGTYTNVAVAQAENAGPVQADVGLDVRAGEVLAATGARLVDALIALWAVAAIAVGTLLLLRRNPNQGTA